MDKEAIKAIETMTSECYTLSQIVRNKLEKMGNPYYDDGTYLWILNHITQMKVKEK